MNSCNIHERTPAILIPQKSPTSQKADFRYNEYSLKQNFFDPSKSSPPNEFILKLKMRLSNYGNVSFIKEDKRTNT